MRWTGQQLASYGALSWSVFKDIAKRLAAVERGVLRRMFGGIQINKIFKK